MGKATTLAVVIGITICSPSFAAARADRLFARTILAVGADDSQPAPSAQELLRSGIKEYHWGHYEEASRAFEQAARLSGLNEKEQNLLAQYRALMGRASKSRSEAASTLEAAQKAFDRGDYKQAETLAAAAAANGHASAQCRDDANALVASVHSSTGRQTESKQETEADRRRQSQQLLATARKHLRDGQLDEAENAAEQAQSLKLNYPAFDDSPAKVLEDVAAARRASKPVRPTEVKPVEPKAKAKSLVAQAESSLHRGELDRAEELAKQAKNYPVKFSFWEKSPDEVLSAVAKARRQQAAFVARNSKKATPANTGNVATTAPAGKPKSPSQEITAAAHQTDNSALQGSDQPVAAASAESAALPAGMADSGPRLGSQPSVGAVTAGPAVESDQAEVRQLVAQARKLMDAGHIAEAEQLLAQAESVGADWGPFDDPTASLRSDLARARAGAAASGASTTAAVSTGQSPAPASGRTGRHEALELLRQGRTHLRAGRFDEAERLARVAREKRAVYRLLDDTPSQLMADVARARARQTLAQPDKPNTAPAGTAGTEVAAVPPIRPSGNAKEANRQAADWLKKARECMNRGEYDSAIDIAQRVEGWQLEYRLFADTPEQVENAARALKSRALARANRGRSDKEKPAAQSLLAEARSDLDAGWLDEAEHKARQAQRLPVTYGVGEDNPVHVLADIARARLSRDSTPEQVTPQPVGSGDVIATSPAAETVPPASGSPSSAASGRVATAKPGAKQAGEPAPHSRTAEAPTIDRAGASRSEGSIETVSAAVPQAPDKPARPSGNEPPGRVLELLTDVGTRPLAAPSTKRASSGPRNRIVAVQQPTPSEPAAPSGGPTVLGPSEPAQQQRLEPIPATQPSAGADRDGQKLELAFKLFEQGRYDRARELAQEVENSTPALRSQAEELLARIGVMEHATAIELYHAGVAAVTKKEYVRALEFFKQVAASQVQLDQATEQQLQVYLRDLPIRIAKTEGSAPKPGTATIVDGQIQTPSAPETPPATESPGQRERIRFQQLVTQTNQKIQGAKRLLPTQPAQAIKELDLAREHVRQSELDESLTAPLVRRLDVAIRYASQEKLRVEAEQLTDDAREAVKAQRERELNVERQKQQDMVKLVQQWNSYMKEGHFADAEAVARKASEISPDSPEVVAMQFKARMELRLQNARDLREKKEEAYVRTLDDVDRANIINVSDEQPMRYSGPKIWEDLTERRRKRLQEIESGQKSPRTMEIERKLTEPITVNFDGTALADVVDFLREWSEVNIVLDHPSLTEDGIGSDRPVYMKLEKVQLKSALNHILNQVNLAYAIQNEALVITTPLKTQGKVITKPYSVGDLVVPIPNFYGDKHAMTMPGRHGGTIGIGPNRGMGTGTPTGLPLPSVGLGQFGSGLAGSSPVGGGTAGGSLLGGAPGGAGAGQGSGQMVDFDSLIELIQNTISPNSWSTVGGQGTIEQFEPNLSLVVSQTQQVHDQIADLLQQLRRLQDLQVTVEVKFITLSEDFFERIGIDFDVLVQSNQEKPLRNFGQALGPFDPTTGVRPRDFEYRDHEDDFAVGIGSQFDQTATRGNFTSDLKIPFRTGGFGKGRPTGFVPGDGLNFGIAFLSDIEVYLFLEAAQQNNRSNVLSAPKVTLFNGQFSFVFSGTIEPFVTELTPVIAAGAVAFDPTIEPFFIGAGLGVQAVISADRRYVRLTLLPFFNSLAGEKRFSVSAGAGGGGGVVGGGASAIVQSDLIVPIIATNFVTTTVSVPDGGTVLMGGLKTKREVRNEFGTPILNKLPYVNRLFMNTGVSSLTTSLLLMVTPRIIIQEEEEDLLGKATIAF